MRSGKIGKFLSKTVVVRDFDISYLIGPGDLSCHIYATFRLCGRTGGPTGPTKCKMDTVVEIINSGGLAQKAKIQSGLQVYILMNIILIFGDLEQAKNR